ncbi:sodium-dependent nutrient amino acid transporter 1-like isoform X3 [Tachypleus tridentatus]
MAVSVFYLIASMSSQLPWTTCDSSWAGDVCNETELMNRSNSCDSNNTEKRISLTELYFKNYVLHLSSGLQEVTMLNWKMCLCLIGAWTMVYFCVIKGVQSLGKVTYFTAIFPYTVLISLMVVALTFDGASDGIKYFFTPHWKKLLKIEVWYRACEQSFFSLAVGYGTLVMYSSYNEFRNNVNRDAIIISVLDTFTSILAGSVVFAVLGTLAHELCIPIEEAVDKEGMGLAFVAYPEALGKIKVVPQLWSVLFFVMLLTLGLGSSIAQVETILTSIKDQYPILQKKKSLVALCLCSVFCLCGLPLTTDAGLYIMTLLDNYGVGTAAFLYCIVETIGLMWIYGWSNFCDDIHFMLNAAVGLYWKVTWIVTAPVILTVIFIYGNVMLVIEKNSEGSSTIPPWGTAIGWVLAAVAIFQIPIWIMRVVYNTKGPQRLKKAFQPQEDWGPSNPTNFISWKTWKSSRKTVENVISAYQNEAFEKDETKF